MSTDKTFYNSIGNNDSNSKHGGTGIEMADVNGTIQDDGSWAAGEDTKMSILDSISGKSNGGVFDAVDNSNNYRFAVNASWAVNWFLLGKKVQPVYFMVLRMLDLL